LTDAKWKTADVEEYERLVEAASQIDEP